uniref:Uncharacterized protein n=1 Tax=Arundo donax TaxID=35708 RepID=A0A0A9FW68_ARUDO
MSPVLLHQIYYFRRLIMC